MPIKMVVRSEFAIVSSEGDKAIGESYMHTVAGLPEALAERIVSRPASGHKQVFNLTWDPINEELIFEVSDTPAS